MKVPVSWLREFVKIPKDCSTNDLHDAFIALGFEVEATDIFGEVSGDLLVGEVIDIKNLDQFKKPIRYCQVKIGSQVRGIVCGATNFAVGDKVVVALPGATLPGNFTITARKTYDHLSDGMICSERELGLSDAHEGILVVNKSIKTGTDAKKLLGLGEVVFDLSVLPDRGYALSMRGVAREISAYFNLKFSDPVNQYRPVKITKGVTKANIAANRFVSTLALITLDGVNPEAETPEFVKQRLNQMGMRAISLPVDITNYVMLELGQPLHAFDRKSIKGTITARFANQGEKIKTLDGINRILKETDLVISDKEKAVSIAGIMGGANSEINSKTKQIVLEAASFDPVSISATARRLALTSEASKRFERGVDQQLPQIAARRAAELLVEYGGGKILGASVKISPILKRSIFLSFELTKQVSGIKFTDQQIKKTLDKIGASYSQNKSGLNVRIPSWRPDLLQPNDLIEEVVRIHGYKFIPSTLPKAVSGRGLTNKQRAIRDCGRILSAIGAHEVLNYPFISKNDLSQLLIAEPGIENHHVKIANPLNEDSPYLRNSLIAGLLQTGQRNLSRGNNHFSIFEIGQCFLGQKKSKFIPQIAVGSPPKNLIQKEIDAALPKQTLKLGLLGIGEVINTGWWGQGYPHSWITVTQQLEIFMTQLDIAYELKNNASTPWHPVRSSEIYVDGIKVGQVGELHPKVCANYSISTTVTAIELDLDLALDLKTERKIYREIGKMPYATEDLAIVVDDSVSALKIQDALMRAAGAVAQSVNLFDVFASEQIGQGKKSLAFRIVFRAEDKTLTPEELRSIRERMIDRLKQDFKASIRA